MCETLQFLDCICGSTTGGLGLLGLYINEKNVGLINQTVESLTEYCQGPCHENQVMHTGLSTNLQLIICYLHLIISLNHHTSVAITISHNDFQTFYLSLFRCGTGFVLWSLCCWLLFVLFRCSGGAWVRSDGKNIRFFILYVPRPWQALYIYVVI